jgi:anti-sigma factor RsiW
MGCPADDVEGEELILAYGANTLPREQQIELERHLEACASCRERAEAQRAVWSALDLWAPAVVSPNFDERLFRRIVSEEQNAWWQRLFSVNWSWRPAIPVAAACAALIAAFLLKSPVLRTEPQSEPQPKLQIEQVEHALDDMDMLKQLGVESPTDKARPSEKI